MPDAPPVWPVPVETPLGPARRHITVRVSDHGDVVLKLPPGVREAVIPAASDSVLRDAIQSARDVSKGVGRRV